MPRTQETRPPSLLAVAARPLAAGPAITVRALSQGRRLFALELGALGTVTVFECPAPALTDDEWQCIGEARESYRHMWGGAASSSGGHEDAADGRGAAALSYRTTHYIATVASPGKPDKIITMRKVAINPAALQPASRDGSPPPLVHDVDFWQVYDRADGTARPLAEAIQFYLELARGLGHYPSPAHLPITALSRSGTLPYERNPARDRDDRNRTAIAYALIQVAALDGDTDTALYVAQICEEFRTHAFALHLPDGSRCELDYTPTVETLGLPARYSVRLDRANPVVAHLLASFPGFWLDNQGLSRLLEAMVEEDTLRPGDFAGAAHDLLASPDALRLAPGHLAQLEGVARGEAVVLDGTRAVAKLLARPRFAKYLIPLIGTHEELRRRILAEVGDGPYSATLDPERYRASVLRLLCVAQDLYAHAEKEVP